MRAAIVGSAVVGAGVLSGAAPVEAAGPLQAMLLNQGPLGLGVALLYQQQTNLSSDLQDLRDRLSRLEEGQ